MILGSCTVDGCAVRTIGSRCVRHEVPVTRTFVRGRPFEHHAATLTPDSRIDPEHAVVSDEPRVALPGATGALPPV